MDYQQSSFAGGINQRVDATKVPNSGDSYYLGINVRNREDVLSPIKKPLDLTDTLPTGKLQGLYGAGTILVLFCGGRPYYRNVADLGMPAFVPLVNPPPMNEDVDYIYAEFVPSSTIGYARKKNADDQQVSFDLNLDLPFISSQQGLIYQDGINTASLIFDNNVQVQKLNTFAEWNTENREYVPVMRQMLYYGGILFGASKDGKELFRSVSGRPLDFVIPVNADGAKVSDVEKEGGASATSKRVDYEAITAIKTTPVDQTIVVGTQNKVFLVQMDPTKEIFSEPYLNSFQIAAVGPVNQFCFVDLLGDTAFITQHGIDSVNSASILKQESKNNPVSADISNIFQETSTKYVSQDFPCAYQFGADFALFAVNTIYGRCVLIYDRTSSKFISIDKYDGVNQIKMFASVIVEGQRRLFYITSDDKFYEAYAGDTNETAQVLIGEWCSNDPKVSQKPLFLHLVFTDCEENGSVTVTPIINKQRGSSFSETIVKKTDPKVYPIVPPFGNSDEDTSQVVSFNLKTVQAGWKIGVFVEWNVNAKLTHINLTTEDQTGTVNQQSMAKRYVSLKS